jgi:hypothetical protein
MFALSHQHTINELATIVRGPTGRRRAEGAIKLGDEAKRQEHGQGHESPLNGHGKLPEAIRTGLVSFLVEQHL